VCFSAFLQTLTFGGYFNQAMQCVNFRASLHTLTFGYDFHLSLHGACFPASVQTLTFGVDVNHRCKALQGVNFRASLQTLTFGYDLNLWNGYALTQWQHMDSMPCATSRVTRTRDNCPVRQMPSASCAESQ
jgi:hypothetical protein